MTWRERIARAQQTGKFTKEDGELACAWVSCAVGEQCVQVPGVIQVSLVGEPYPLDHALDRYGYLFYRAVGDHDFKRAEHWLDKIEDRVLELKRLFVGEHHDT